MYAIEEALRIKEKFGGKVSVISMGPPQVEEALREAISLGTDEAIHLCDRAFAGSDTLATSYTLAKGIEKIGEFDLIICGKQAIDGDTAQVGPGISVHLNIPQATYIRKIEEIKEGTEASASGGHRGTREDKEKKKTWMARVERMTEEGYDIIETPLPAVFTVVKEINEPRLPSLKGKLRAKKAEITRWTKEDLALDEKKIGLDGSPTQVIKIFTPPPRKGGKILSGETEDVVNELTSVLEKEI